MKCGMSLKPSNREGPVRAQLTGRDLAILDAVTCRVKVLSLAQVARTWWQGPNGVRNARKRVRFLESAGHVQLIPVLAGDEVALSGTVAVWWLGLAVPDFAAVVRQTQTRWDGPVRTILCVVGTDLAAARTGGVARWPRLSETTHDLHLSQVYLHKLRTDPRTARRWCGEAQLMRMPGAAPDKVPDALVRLAGRCMAIEVIGSSYDAAKLRSFHDYCAAHGFAYEMW